MPSILAWGQSLFLLLKGVITVVLNDTEEIRRFTDSIILTTICWHICIVCYHYCHKGHTLTGLGAKIH